MSDTNITTEQNIRYATLTQKVGEPPVCLDGRYAPIDALRDLNPVNTNIKSEPWKPWRGA